MRCFPFVKTNPLLAAPKALADAAAANPPTMAWRRVSPCFFFFSVTRLSSPLLAGGDILSGPCLKHTVPQKKNGDPGGVAMILQNG
jgi:hypothetical protein